MIWFLLAAVAVALIVLRLARQRDVVTMSPSEPISTLNLDRSRRTTDEKKAALKAANQMLR
jgi:hypothetical protein